MGGGSALLHLDDLTFELITRAEFHRTSLSQMLHNLNRQSSTQRSANAAALHLHFHSAAAGSAGRSRADGKDWIFDIDTSGFIEFQRGFDGLALFKRLLEVAEHDVEAHWRK